MEANKISLKTFTVSIAAILGIETVFRLMMVKQAASPLLSLSIIRCLEAVLLVVITLQFEKDPGAIGLSRAKFLPGFGKGLIWSACFGIAAGILHLVLLLAGINAMQLLNGPQPSLWTDIFVLILVGSIIGPVAEEIFFRGIIYGFFRRWGAITALILSTVIFVLTHPIGSNLPLTQLVGGVVFAVAYEKEQNLMAPITIHCLGNLTIFSLIYFK